MSSRPAPDGSLADHGPEAIEHRGLIYPFGERAPGLGEIIEVAPGVRWGRLPLFEPLGHINVWALDDGDGIALVDTGIGTARCRETWDAMLSGPLAGKPVTRIIATHMHPDHVGLAGWLADRFGTQLWMTRTEYLMARLLAADVRDEPPPEAFALWRGAGWPEEVIEAERARGWGRFAKAVDPLPLGHVRVRDGDVLEIGGRWQVIVGSGHSPEHLCLVDHGRKVMIAGDQVLPRISSNISLSLTEPEGDPLGEWLDSIARFRAVLPDDLLVLPAHGSPFRGLHPRLDALAQGHRKQLDRLAAKLAEAPARAVDCFTSLFARKIDAGLYGLATGETLAHLRRLERTDRAVREERYGVWWWRAIS